MLDARGGKDRQTTQTRNTQTDTQTQTESEKTTREQRGILQWSLSHQGSGGWGERMSMAVEDGRRITENLSEGMAIGEETLQSPAVNSQHL